MTGLGQLKLVTAESLGPHFCIQLYPALVQRHKKAYNNVIAAVIDECKSVGTIIQQVQDGLGRQR